MIECLIIQLAIACNIHTMECYQMYRCEGEKNLKYLNLNKPFKGRYNINNNIFIIEDERKCL